MSAQSGECVDRSLPGCGAVLPCGSQWSTVFLPGCGAVLFVDRSGQTVFFLLVAPCCLVEHVGPTYFFPLSKNFSCWTEVPRNPSCHYF
jgi:hypothetical protein